MGRNTRIMQENDEGRPVLDKAYVKPTLPQVRRRITPNVDYKTNRIALDIKQEDLDKLVAEIGFYDQDQKLIKEAPMKNPNAPFWKHRDLYLDIPGSGLTLDDEIARDRFWLEVMKADRRFILKGDSVPPSRAKKVLYTIKKVSDEVSGLDESQDELFLANELLVKHQDDHEKLVDVLVAMGTKVKKGNPKVVRNALMTKITQHKDQKVPGTEERNIEAFIRLMQSNTEEIAKKKYISEALKKGILTRDDRNEYFYGDLSLGGSRKDTEEFLLSEEGKDIMDQIMVKLSKLKK